MDDALGVEVFHGLGNVEEHGDAGTGWELVLLQHGLKASKCKVLHGDCH